MRLRALAALSFTAATALGACSSDPAPASESCTIEEGVEGAVTIRCPDGSEVSMERGGPAQEPGSCSVADNGDGTVTIHCPDGTTATVTDGRDGKDGSDGEDGTRISWLEGTSCVSLQNGDHVEVSCLGGDSRSLTPDCSIERRVYSGIAWTTYSCPDGESGIIDVQREPFGMPKMQLVTGLNHSCVLSNEGRLSCWGDEDNPQITDIPNEPLVAVATGYHHSCALRPDRRTICWGANNDSQSEPPSDERFIQLGVGLNHSCGLREDGTTRCWGSVGRFELNDPLEERYVQIAVAEHNTCGLRSDGSVSCWGSDSYQRGSPHPDERYLVLAAGAGHFCGIRLDHTVSCWGLNDSLQASPPEDQVFTHISAGFRHSCGLTEEGSAICWGEEGNGRALPPEDKTFASLANGDRHGCGMTTRGPIFCWGDDNDGQASPPAPFGCFPPGADPAGTFEGMSYQGWNESYTTLPPNFLGLGAPPYTGILDTVQVPPALLEDPGTHFALVMEGLMHFEEDEILTFRLRSDDGSKLFLDDHLLVDNDGMHTAITRESPGVCLGEGWHQIEIHYFQALDDAELSLHMSRDGVEFVPAGPFYWEPPPPAPTALLGSR